MDMEVIIMVMDMGSSSMENSASMESLASDGSDAVANMLNMQL
jgi:CO dehydrogenase nickel-insertion accessory protein CooC1